jgi:hypothetical protein
MLTAGAGAIASVASQNAALASIPITALVALGLLDRRRVDRHLKTWNSKVTFWKARSVRMLASCGPPSRHCPTQKP